LLLLLLLLPSCQGEALINDRINYLALGFALQSVSRLLLDANI
jgi:hypothetical protein